MSAASEVYITGTFSEPMSAQHNFQNTYNMADPIDAMSRYAQYVVNSLNFRKVFH